MKFTVGSRVVFKHSFLRGILTDKNSPVWKKHGTVTKIDDTFIYVLWDEGGKAREESAMWVHAADNILSLEVPSPEWGDKTPSENPLVKAFDALVTSVRGGA